jgi:hypothetical protein
MPNSKLEKLPEMASGRTSSIISLSSLATTADISEGFIFASIMCTKVSSFDQNLTTSLYCSLIYLLRDLMPDSEAYYIASLMVGTGLFGCTLIYRPV